MKRVLFFTLAVCFGLSACRGETGPTPMVVNTRPVVQVILNPTKTSTPKAEVTSSASVMRATVTPTNTSTPPRPMLDPADWKNWPVIPNYVDPSLRSVYEHGISLGNDPHAFSIFGDCQTRPGVFFGVFETDPATIQSLSPELRDTVNYFNGSFNRESPTTLDGTTPGALLWTQWHRGEFGCSFSETPVECELRIHRPSFVIIQVGTHFESRNTDYLRKIIGQLLDAGVVPILATKADNREKDERINKGMSLLASEYDLPLWNFWAAVSDLPNRGLYVMQGREEQGAIYLDEQASIRHRMTGLETLNFVWRSITGK